MDDSLISSGHTLDVVNPPEIAAHNRADCPRLHGFLGEPECVMDGFGSRTSSHNDRHRRGGDDLGECG